MKYTSLQRKQDFKKYIYIFSYIKENSAASTPVKTLSILSCDYCYWFPRRKFLVIKLYINFSGFRSRAFLNNN